MSRKFLVARSPESRPASRLRWFGCLSLAFSLTLPGLGCAPPAKQAAAPVADVRKSARGSKNQALIARWLLAELLSPDGNPEQAKKARAELGEAGGGMYAELGRGLDDAQHGRLKSVADHYLKAVQAARESDDENAPLVAWFASQQATLFRRADPKLYERWKQFVDDALANPRNIGWRARADLSELWQEAAFLAGAKDVLEQSAKLNGCATSVRLAGPFGRNAARDTARSFAAERPGPWPLSFKPDEGMGDPPRIIEIERDGCFVTAKENVNPGIYYAESFFQLDAPGNVLVAVQGAYGVWIDDQRVLERDLRQWGSWPHFGTLVALGPGRHRLVARVGEPGTSIRLMHEDGRPLGAPTSTDPSLPYVLATPRVLPNANVLDRYLSGGKLRDPKDDVTRYLGAVMANAEAQADVASVLLEPLVARPEHATGPALSAASIFTQNDPILSDSQRSDLGRELQERAAARDAHLWYPRLMLAIGEAERSGKSEAARSVKKLVDEFPDVPAILGELTRLYAELGWRVEHGRAAIELAKRFPADPSALEPAIQVLDARGQSAEADELVQRIQKLDADREVLLARALDRQDYDTALKELRRIAQRRPQRKDIAERISDVMVRAGNGAEAWKKLEAALKQDSKSEKARLALADAGLAAGKRDALVRALLEAISSGAPSGKLEEAIDLVEGASELEPYRHDAKKIIAEYEKSGETLSGTAARVLDYAAVWVHADGSSRMLEHEIIKVQSAEAVTDMAEQPLQNGLILHLRVIKKDGSVLEPEFVEGKPTVTMPHLEIGDYIETERIETQPGDGQRGARFMGPRWFFREENIAYARSEFLVISPKSRPLDIETRNDVPKPEVHEDGAIIARRWRVDRSPAAPVEPFGAPIVEFLPSVQVGWGVSEARTLEAMADASVDLTPVDPRIERIARHIVERAPAERPSERAKLIYHWLVTNVQEGEESDGRRVIIGKNGNLWRGFITLCRAVNIPVEYAVAQSRLTLAANGPFSAAQLYTLPLVRVSIEKGEDWLTLGSKYAPFGYVPAEARGMPAFVLSESGPRAVRVPSTGLADRVTYVGDVRLAADGSADVELEQTLSGKYATGLRGALAEMATQQIRDLIETRLLGHALRGAKLEKYEIVNASDPDKPIAIRTRSRVPSFAQVAGGVLLVSPPFAPRVSQLAALPTRQTPLLLADSSEQQIVLTVHPPAGSSLGNPVAPQEISNGAYKVSIRDREQAGAVVLDRRIVLPAGRVQVAAYPEFLKFARKADDALFASVRIRVGR